MENKKQKIKGRKINKKITHNVRTSQNSGITLVALIITIIILLILAVVAIRAVSNDGIISHAKNAQTGYEQAQNDEKEKMLELEYEIEKLQGTTTASKADYLLDKLYSVKVGDTVNYQDGVGGYTWKVLGIKNGNVLLVSAQNLDIDGDGDYYDADDYKVLSGKDGYNNGINILNDMCKPLGQGKGAIGARSITAEDINNITGYDPSNRIEGIIDGVKYGGGPCYKGEWHEYGSTATYQMKNGNITYSNTNGLTSNEAKVNENTTYTVFTNLDGSVLGETPLNVKNTCYGYRITNAKYYPTNYVERDGQTFYNMPESLFNTIFDNPDDQSLPYWLATQGVWAREIGVSYGLLNTHQEVGKNGAYVSRGTYLYHTCKGEATVGGDNSDGTSSPYKDNQFGVRPVVILDSNVKFTSNANGGYDINI